MKRAWIAWIFVSAACLSAQSAPSPELDLDINAQADAAVAKGWPLLIRVAVASADGQQVSVRPRRTLAEISNCGPWQMAATGFPAAIISRARSTIACRIRILSGACPPGITSASM